VNAPRFDQLTRTLARRALIAGALGLVAAPVRVRAAVRTTCRAAGQGCTHAAQCCSGRCAVGKDLPRRQRNRCLGACETSSAFVCGVDIAGARIEVAEPPGLCWVWYPSPCASNADCRTILVDRDPDGPVNEGWDGFAFSCLIEAWYNGRRNPTITPDRTFCFAVDIEACVANNS